MAYLLYCSQPSQALSPMQLRRLVSQATARNRARRLSGVLLHGDGFYVQWLEGPESALQSAWDSILRNPLHRRVTLLLRSDREGERLYPSWPLRAQAVSSLVELTHLVHDVSRHGRRVARLRTTTRQVLTRLLSVVA